MSRLIQTYTGKMVDPLQPDASVVDIVDIAWSLAHTCRFRGHCLRYYSVAEHCLRGMGYAGDEIQLSYLLHDASEAYLMDVPAPIKGSMLLVESVEASKPYAWIEREWDSCIRRSFGIGWPTYVMSRVKVVDERMLATERRDLMRPTAEPWANLEGIDPYPDMIAVQPDHKYMPEPMAHAFLEAYGRLTGDKSWRERL